MRASMLMCIGIFALFQCAAARAFLKPGHQIESGFNLRLNGHGKQNPVEASTTLNSDITPTEAQMQAMSGDWLFHVKTTSCRGTAFDNTTVTLFSRMFLPVLFGATVWALTVTAFNIQPQAGAQKLLMGANSTSSGQAPITAAPESTSLGTESKGPEAKTRLWHVDFARICAVMCVIFEHCGGENYTHRNGVFGLWWALPYLYMSSGIGLMMSKSSMAGYVARLVCLLLVGVGANWFADASTHRDWQHDFGNTVFQMFFVVMLIAMCINVEPLRQSLRRRMEDPNSKPSQGSLIAAVCWGILALVGLWFFMSSRTLLELNSSSDWGKYYAPIVKNIPIMLVQICGTLFFSIFATIVSRPENTGYVGWAILAFIYLPMIVIPWDQNAFPHFITLYIFAMVVTVWPLKGSDTISTLTRSYWPFLLMLLAFISMADMWGRCDVHPPFAAWERFRMNLGEFILVICFLCGGFAPSDPYKVTTWMGWWALYAYCFHIMWFRLFGSPWAAVIIFLSIIPFYALHVLTSKETQQATSDRNASMDKK